MIDLGSLGGTVSQATAVNPSGAVAGTSATAGGSDHAFSWTASGGMVDLGTLGGTTSYANAISPSGEIVGDSAVQDGDYHAYDWTLAGGMTDLGSLYTPGDGYSNASAVNSSGTIAGVSETPGPSRYEQAVEWSPSGQTTLLGTLGGNQSGALAVNDSGEVVGASDLPGDRSEHAFSWTPSGGMVDLGTLDPSDPTVISEAVAVNDAGDIIGFGDACSSCGDHVIEWTPDGAIQDLGTLNPGSQMAESLPGDNPLSSIGRVTGLSRTEPGFHAFIWAPSSGMTDLGTLGGSMSTANGSNSSGEVTGYSTLPGDASTHAVVWQPTTTNPPTATITAPADGQTYLQNQAVATSFTCNEGTGAPGLRSCIDSTGSTSPGQLDTTTVGAHTYAVTATSNDGETGSASISYTVDQPPAITSASSTSTGMRVPFDFSITTTGYPTPRLGESGSLPAGVSFVDNGDGTADIKGTAPAGSAGTYPITITASNGAGSPATQSFTLTVTTTASAPTITSAASDTETFGVRFSFTVNTTGYPTPALSKVGSFPSGVSFKSNGDGTATISGTPARSAVGPYTLTINAKNKAGAASQQFTLTITKAPVIQKIPTKTGAVGQPLTLTIKSSGYTTPTLSESGSLPAGITFTANGDGTATITGTPETGSGGSYPFTITATNALGSSSASSTFKIDEAPSITSPASAIGAVGTPFSFQVTATGYPSPKVTIAGKLPKGLRYNATTATLSGTPANGSSGAYPLTITARNTDGSATQSFELTVE